MRYLFVLMTSVFGFVVKAQEIPRKAWIGAIGNIAERGMAVDSVVQGSTMYKLGLRAKDTLVMLNGLVVQDAANYNIHAGNIRTGDKVNIAYLRGDKRIEKTGKAIMRPYDTSSLADIYYDWVSYEDCKLRVVVRKPKGRTNVPAVLLVPGYNCGSIEGYSQGSYGKLITEWLKGGFAVVTIEKAGLGDSYHCIPCSEADLVTDIQTFDAGYCYMEGLSYVDTSRLFIWGHSMGGIIAPEIAKQHHPRGVIVFATVFRPWSEFLLEMHRVQAPLDGKSYEETESFVRGMQQIYYAFFIGKRSPGQITKDPAFAGLPVSELEYKEGNNDMWGRHWRFWQQIDSLDMADSWSKVNCPVLSVFGGADFIACSELEHQLIVRTVNATHPGNGTHITIPDIDHLLVQNKDWKSAHKNFSNKTYRDTHFHYGFTKAVIEWMTNIME